jgi:VanZ family protein
MPEQPPPARVTPIPRRWRLAVFLAAVAVILWLTLAPAHDLPSVNLWDKAEHAGAFFGLTFLGVWALPDKRLRVAAGVLALGIAIEFAQAWMPLGRDGDVKDAVADAIGIAIALPLALLAREVLHRLWPALAVRLTLPVRQEP